MHHPLVLVSVWVEHNLSIETYNTVVASVFIVVTLVLSFLLFRKLAQQVRNYKLEILYLIGTLVLLVVHSRFMFDSNIEVIHSLEFAILAFLLFPLSKRFGAAVFFTLPFMLIDEWYQYTVLYPQWNDYFDLNDILTDTYGCGLTMVGLMIMGAKGDENIRPLWKRPEFIGLLGGAILVLLLVKICFISAYANEACGNTWLVMNERSISEPFWRPHPTHHISFHVMKPSEGFIAIILLHLFYFGLDFFRIKRRAT
jgi:hypothetical protein